MNIMVVYNIFREKQKKDALNPREKTSEVDEKHQNRDSFAPFSDNHLINWPADFLV